ncbi:MAG TPA: hypothetical protein VGM31_16895, partial [Puia sp.]
MEKEHLHRYFSGLVTPEEEEEVLRWVQQDESHYQQFMEERRLWDLLLFHSDAARAGTVLPEQAPVIRRILALPARYRAWTAAAALILGIGIGWISSRHMAATPRPLAFNTIEVPAGQR